MSRRDQLTALALFVVACGYFSLTLTRTFDLRDEGYLLGRAAQVADGAAPHRDFADVYGPGVLAATAVALRVGDGEILAVRILLAGLKALTVVLGFAVARRLVPWGPATFAALLAVVYWGRFASNLNTPYAALFTIPLGFLALWLLMDGLGRRSARHCAMAGVAAGAAVIFKQSLGIMLAYGLLLAILAVEAGAAETEEGRAREASGTGPARALPPLLWLLAGAAVLAPTLRYLGPRDYVLHLLPLHGLMAIVAWRAWRNGPRSLPEIARRSRRTLLPFLAGALLVPAGTVLFYLAIGGLDALVYDMFVLPLSLRGYYVAAVVPPWSLAVFLLGVIALLCAGLSWLGGRARASRWLALAGAALAVFGPAIPSEFPRLFEPGILLHRAPFSLEGILLAALLWVGIALYVRPRLGVAASADQRRLLLPLLFGSAMLCFEVFPRAGHNLWILHGALAPLLALAVAAGYRLAGAEPLAPRGIRRVTAVALVAMVPIWLVAPLVPAAIFPSEPRSAHRALALPHTRGLALGPRRIADGHLGELEELIAYLATARPRDAPILVLTNDQMIPFASGRESVLSAHAYALFLAGWGMLPSHRARALDGPELIDRLRQEPDVLVVHRIDATAANLREALPKLRGYVEANFEVVARFGKYRLLRRRGRDRGPRG